MPAQLTEDIIRALSTPQSFERGQQYYRLGAVFNTTRQEDLLIGECEGSMAPAYRLRVKLDEGGVRSAFCSCPYEMGGYCKHIIALLLAFLNTPEEFTEGRGLDEMLAGLTRDDLVSLFKKMVENKPNLYDWLETAIAVASATSKPEGSLRVDKRQTQVSAKTYQRKIRNILHRLAGSRMSEFYWITSDIMEELEQVVNSAEAFLEAGDAEGAITILMVLLKEVTNTYDQFDDSDGEFSDFLEELGQPLAEAILSAELSEGQRQGFTEELETIINELSDYGIDGLEVALAALAKGWQDVHESEKDWEAEGNVEWADEDGNEWYCEMDLTHAKLNVLERQGRIEEYLRLCQQEGEYRRYTLKLLEVGRNEEAILIAMNHLTSSGDVFSAAQKLRDMGHIQEAIALGERGLSLAGDKYMLGEWLGKLEEAQGHTNPAIQAYLAAFTSIPSLELYQTVKRLAGSDWNKFRSEMIKILQADSDSSVLSDVYLLEGDWDRAIHVADQAGFWSYSLIEKVADAVISHRPDWVIRVSIKQADSLIEKTQSKYYPIAARWLLKAKMAYLASGRHNDWQAYLSDLKTKYARRPALQRELRGL